MRADLARLDASTRRTAHNTLRAVQTRQTAALAAHDRRIAWQQARERLARLAVIALAVFLCFFLFYVATN